MSQMSKTHLGLIALIIVLVIVVLINIHRPFITTHPASAALKIIRENDHNRIVKQVRAEFADIVEKSLISRGEGFDTDTQSYQKPAQARPAKSASRLVVSEGFDTTLPLLPEAHELRLFFRPDCSYSMSFMPIWLELVKALPSNVSVKEINCSTLDDNGVSVCANWLEYGGGITSVPAVQLVSNIAGVKRTRNYTGTRSYQQFQNWLASLGITLRYNPDAEHFTDTNPLGHSHSTKEGFAADIDNLLSQKAAGDAGKLADNYNKAYLGLAQEDSSGNIYDVDKDGFYRASFSRCQPDPQGPEGYQVFTRRGQWGCVVPEPNTGIKTDFDAAFSAVDSYLSMLPLITDPATGKATGATRTDEQRMAMKRGMATKYSKEIREFGLCDERQLRQKYNVYEAVKSGKAKLPDGIELKDYLDTQESAAAIFDACSL
jgi:thiol-disulfide isomerase/thioredoxin